MNTHHWISHDDTVSCLICGVILDEPEVKITVDGETYTMYDLLGPCRGVTGAEHVHHYVPSVDGIECYHCGHRITPYTSPVDDARPCRRDDH